MMWEETCKFLCEVPMTDQIREKLRSMIADEYQVNFLADGLPAATRFRVQNKDTNDGEDYTMTLPNGFPLGVEKDGQYYLYNHVRIWMQSHQRPNPLLF